VLDGLNQDPTAEAPIVDYHSSPERVYAVANLTAAYAAAGATRITRRVELGAGRRMLTVEDKVEASRAVNISWRMYTHAAVELNGPTALLTQNGKCLRLELDAPEGTVFRVEEVTLDPPQLPAVNTRRILAELPALSSAHIRAILIPEE
jgi:hypothetical protein